MLAAVVLMALLTSAHAQLACPPACRCRQYADGPDELRCNFPTGKLKLQVQPYDYLEITCEDGQLQCPDELPQLYISRNSSLSRLGINNCSVRGPLACWLHAAGARGVHELVLAGVKNALAPEHVAGLGDLRELIMLETGAIPSEILASIPNLKKFKLRHANLPTPSPLKGFSNLESLELSDDRIESLADAAFQLQQLKVLMVRDNKIENITEETFLGLSSLQILDLRHNKIRALPARLFSQMPRLEILYLNSNSIKEVHTDAFYGLRALKMINASDNHAGMLLSPRSLSNLPSLVEIWLKCCKIESIPSDLFLNSPQLHSIFLAKNLIKVVPEDLFRDQRLLRTLDLSNNKIEQLAKNVFRPLANFAELNLDNNFLSELNEDLFAGLSKLHTVRVNKNRLQHIAGSAFSHAAGLKHVSLADNQLSFQSVQSPFNRLHGSLQYLDLSGNNISRICGDWQNVLTRLKMLNLSRNVIEDLAGSDLQFRSSEILVDLRNNHITRVIFSTSSTKILYPHILLDNNHFICDCKNQDFFNRTKDTPNLDIGNVRCTGPPHLSGELVRNIDPKMLTCPLETGCPYQCTCDVWPAAQRLRLTCSSLPQEFPDPTKLAASEYTLTHTELTLTSVPAHLNIPNHVDTVILSNLNLREIMSIPPSVHYMDLTNNRLAEIPVMLLMRNMTLKLSGNPFVCDCSHEDAIHMLKNNKRKILDHYLVTCSDLQIPWQIDVPRLCSVQNAVIIGSSLAVLSLSLVALAGLYCRYSMQIKIILYSCDKLRWLVAEQDVDRDKKYDAFVSFSHKDEKFVAETLVPVLEGGPRPLKLCVHYRDWVVGEWIPAQIVSSVEQSRRTIIILSKSFVESIWGTMEFRVAYKRSQEERRTRVIVILLEDAPSAADLDAELRAYLSTNTYIKWGDPWFWEKLRYAIAGGRLTPLSEAGPAPQQILDSELNSDGKTVSNARDCTPTAEFSMSNVSIKLT